MLEALRKSRLYLVLNVEFDTLYDNLIDQDIFSQMTLENIRAGQDRAERVRRMLEHLNRRPGNCYEKFKTALTNSGQEHCSTEIEKHYIKSGPTQASDCTPGQSDVVWEPSEGNEVSLQLFVGSKGHSDVPLQQYFKHTEAMEISEHPFSYGFPETVSSGGSGIGFSTAVQESSSVAAGELSIGSGLSVCLPSEYGDVQMEEINISVNDMSATSTSAYPEQFRLKPDKVYRMESTPRGMALVINNEKFDRLPSRPGSIKDMNYLHQLFKKLGFHVSHEVNCTAKKMKELLANFSRKRELEPVDSLIVVILSHGGGNGIIYGVDGHSDCGHAAPNSYITDDDVRDYFSARKCPQMAGKPKLFIVQACRGKNEDSSGSTTAPPPSCDSGNSLHTEGNSMVSSYDSSGSRRSADMADFCLIHSSASGYVAYRHPHTGSPFINTLFDVFCNLAATEHILDIMTEVTRELSNQSLTKDDKRTVPSTTHMLTKKWFFNPPNSSVS